MTKPAITDPDSGNELAAPYPEEIRREGNVPPGPSYGVRGTGDHWPGLDGVAKRTLMAAHVARLMGRPARRTAPGPLRSRPEHWEALTATQGGFAALVVNLALGEVTRGVVRGHSCGEIIAIEKDNWGIRPLIMHRILRRMGLAAVARVTQAQARAATGVHQLGIGTPDSCAKAYHALGSLARLTEDRVNLALSVRAAHQSLDRAYMREEVRSLCPVLDVPMAVWYPSDEVTVHWWRTTGSCIVDVKAQRGVDQGCPLANPVFGISSAVWRSGPFGPSGLGTRGPPTPVCRRRPVPP